MRIPRPCVRISRVQAIRVMGKTLPFPGSQTLIAEVFDSMNKLKDFFYNNNDIIIVLLILAAAACLICDRIGIILSYS